MRKRGEMTSHRLNQPVFIGMVGVIGASRGTGLQCVLYLAKKKVFVLTGPCACSLCLRSRVRHEERQTEQLS